MSRSVSTREAAERLHSVAIHLLRRLRREDDSGPLAAPELSALSVIVFGGPLTLGELAKAEQVRPPTVTRTVAALEERGLVNRDRDPDDGRVTLVRATPAGTRMLEHARARRVSTLADSLGRLPLAEQRAIIQALTALETVARSANDSER